MAKLSPRGTTMRWLSSRRGCYEQPAGSNRDKRKDGILAAQRWLARGDTWLDGTAWCATWAMRALGAAGVKGARNGALASVAKCEEYARAHRAPFTGGWIQSPKQFGKHWKQVYRGDGLVMFGHGVHYATLRDASLRYRLLGYVLTDEGNTTPEGKSGDQANGGTSALRRRPISSIYGICRVDFPNA